MKIRIVYLKKRDDFVLLENFFHFNCFNIKTLKKKILNQKPQQNYLN